MDRKLLLLITAIFFTLTSVQAAPPQGQGTNGNPYKTTHGNPFVAIKAETNELFASVASLEERVTIAEQNIAALQQKAADLQLQILTNDGDIAALKAELADTNVKIYQLQMDLKQLENVVATKQNIIQGKCPDGEYLSQINPDGSIVCQTDAGATGIRRFGVFKDEYLQGPSNPSGTISATCPSGSTAISGSYTADLSVNVTASELRGNSWSVDAGLWPLFYFSGGYVAVHAICLTLN